MPGKVPKYCALIAPQLKSPIHQHIFNVRMDMMIDGPNNSVYKVDVVPEENDELVNPYGNAFYDAKSTLLLTELLAAQHEINRVTPCNWKIVNPSKTNAVGYSRG
jgi:primary-amine oxidase